MWYRKEPPYTAASSGYPTVCHTWPAACASGRTCRRARASERARLAGPLRARPLTHVLHATPGGPAAPRQGAARKEETSGVSCSGARRLSVRRCTDKGPACAASLRWGQDTVAVSRPGLLPHTQAALSSSRPIQCSAQVPARQRTSQTSFRPSAYVCGSASARSPKRRIASCHARRGPWSHRQCSRWCLPTAALLHGSPPACACS
jgi:hypothetical protein